MEKAQAEPEALTGEEAPVGAETGTEPGEADHGDTQTTALDVIEPSNGLTSPIPGMTWNRDQIDLVKRTVAKGASDDELRLFMHVSGRTGLDPFARQIYFIKRWDPESNQMVFQPQTAIDGFRLIAERTGEYEGREGPFWAGVDGTWRDAWLDDDLPAAAKVIVHRKGRQPTSAVALMREYVQRKRDGSPMRMWSKEKGMPTHMLGKVAESLALRAAFPHELGDVYSFEELPTPTEQGPDAAEDAEIVHEAAPVGTVDELLAELAMMKARTGWSQNEVLRAASTSFGRKITKLRELTEAEARQIIHAAQAARA